MFDGTLESDDDKFQEFEKELSAHFKDDVGGIALKGIELVKLYFFVLIFYFCFYFLSFLLCFFVLFKQAFFPIRKSGHFFVVVFSLTKRVITMTILDNSNCGATYEEKYEDSCELLVSTFMIYSESHGILSESHGIET